MLYTSNTFVNYNHPVKEANVAFLGIPFTSTSISKPARFGPVVVREALKLLSGTHKGKDVFKKYKFCDLGDLEIVAGSFEKTSQRLKETIQEMLHENKKIFPIFVGGEHLITLPIVEALKSKTIIQLDAHSDLLQEYNELEHSHATWAYHASKKAKTIQIGVHDYDEEERAVMKKHSVVAIQRPEQLKKIKIERPLHLTVDVDVLEPHNINTGFPEGAMSQIEFFSFLDKINPDSLDIVEIAEDRLGSNTGFFAAKIIKTVLGNRMHSKH